jgi:putative phage-type endonuclease
MSVYEEKESYAISRAGGIGGTDMAAILGLSPWKRPIDVYAAKVDPESVPEIDNEMLWWGRNLEPIVRRRYAERFGVTVAEPNHLAPFFTSCRSWGEDSTIITGKESWMLAAPDGWIPSVRSGLEVKCSGRKSSEWGDEGSEDVPAHYAVQAAWYAAVCDAAGWNFAVLFSGNTLQQYRITRDLELERDMITAARSFWHDNIQKRVEPAIDESESYGKYLARKFSLNTGAVISNPSPEILDWAAKMKLADNAEKEFAEIKREANNHLRALVGNAQKAMTPLGSIGWVRPEMKDVTDWAEVGKQLGVYSPEVVAKFTKPRQNEAYLRAWWKK